jgi:hypothetical protein
MPTYAALDYYCEPRHIWALDELSRDPCLEPIHDHPGWLALVEKYKRQ